MKSPTNNRIAILDCALELFAARGYDSIGVQELVTKAGIAKPTLYYYFGSKKGLLETLFQERFKPFINQLTAAATYTNNLTYTLQKVVQSYFQFAQNDPKLYQLHLSFWYELPDNEASLTIRPFVSQQLQIIENLFHRAAQDNGNMTNRETLYATTFLNMLNGHIMLMIKGQSEWNDHTVWQVVQYFSHGIYS